MTRESVRVRVRVSGVCVFACVGVAHGHLYLSIYHKQISRETFADTLVAADCIACCRVWTVVCVQTCNAREKLRAICKKEINLSFLLFCDFQYLLDTYLKI